MSEPQLSHRPPSLPSDCETRTLGVAFVDMSRFAVWVGSEQDTLVADFLQRFYRLSTELAEGAQGRIVKFMGDGVLAVFPPESMEPMVTALGTLAKDARQLGHEFGIDTYLNINVHVGSVVCGSFGAPDQERFDVIGKTVNIAARLGRRGMTLSPQAFRCLGPEARKSFDKNMPPITYRRPTG